MSWFTLNVITRPAQKLAVTTMEMTTLAFIFFAFGTSVCWWYKPRDVEVPIILNTDYTIEQILLDAGDAAAEPYRLTPLDFIGREEWIFSTTWIYCVNVLGKLNVIWKRPSVLPIQMITSFNFPRLSMRIMLLPISMTIAYSAIFVAAWNFYFPTEIERLIWRSCASLTMGLCLTGAFFELFFMRYDRYHGRPASPSQVPDRLFALLLGKHGADRLKRALKNLQNNSRGKDPALEIPVHSVVITLPILAMYTICRWYILLEDIIGLRSLPASAFQTVDWTRYLPHY